MSVPSSGDLCFGGLRARLEGMSETWGTCADQEQTDQQTDDMLGSVVRCSVHAHMIGRALVILRSADDLSDERPDQPQGRHAGQALPWSTSSPAPRSVLPGPWDATRRAGGRPYSRNLDSRF